MNKKFNSVIFILLASIFNLVLTVLIFIPLAMLTGLIGKHISTTFSSILFIIIIPTSFFTSFLIYYNFVDFLDRKFDLSKYINVKLMKKKK